MTLPKELIAIFLVFQAIDSMFDAIIWSGEGRTVLWWGIAAASVPAYIYFSTLAWRGRIA
jgi:hypothetical protein